MKPDVIVMIVFILCNSEFKINEMLSILTSLLKNVACCLHGKLVPVQIPENCYNFK